MAFNTVMSYIIFLIIYFIPSLKCVKIQPINIEINANGSRVKFPHFWKSTGFCPPDPKDRISSFLLSEDEKINLALIGSLPYQGISNDRIHWLFNLISYNQHDSSYNFTHLDTLINYLNKYDLNPGFELMGHPTGIDPKNSELKTENFWFDLVNKLGQRYLDQFNLLKLSKWRFETWNEPDLKTYNILNFTFPDYLNYVNGCAKGLKCAFNSNRGIKLGGPAGLFKNKDNHPLCWGLLNICNSSESHCPIQYISFHRKGEATSRSVLNGTLELLDLIYNQFPKLRHFPVANDEADILKTWSKSLDWRGDVRYAAMVAKVICDYFEKVRLEENIEIDLLSNDNAFLNYHPFYFTQRTLFARFQMNFTNPPHRQFIKKPVYSLMALLSLLGDEFLVKDASVANDPLLTVMATTRSRKQYSIVSVLLVYGNDTQTNIFQQRQLHVEMRNLQNNCNGMFVVWTIDNVRTNPYRVWQDFNRPVFPGKEVRNMLRGVEEIFTVIKVTSFNSSTINVTLNATIPSVFLAQFCCKPFERPAKVKDVRVLNVTQNEILLTWKYRSRKNRCIQRYEVEQSPKCSDSSKFERVNPNDTIFLSYHHSPTVANDRYLSSHTRLNPTWEINGEATEIDRWEKIDFNTR